MAIDDPLEAAARIISDEERIQSPVRRYAAEIATFAPGILGKALSRVLRSDAVGRLAYLAEVLKQELARVRSVAERLQQESSEHKQFAEDEWPELLMDGMRRAERTRAKDRIARIAAILTNSLVTQPAPTGDDVEEWMRIATELSDRDVLALNIIVSTLRGHSWADRLTLRQAHDQWKTIPWKVKGYSDSEVESICSKLSSFGLLARLDLPPNQNMLTTEHNSYELLQKGKQFVQFAALSH